MAVVNSNLSIQIEPLPETLAVFERKYREAVPAAMKPRTSKILHWSLHASRRLLLSSAPASESGRLVEINTLAILLNVMIDDLADLAPRAHRELGVLDGLEEALRIVVHGRKSGANTGPLNEYFTLMLEIRSHLLGVVSQWPSFELWLPDLKDFLDRLSTAMRMSAEWNRSFDPDFSVKAPIWDIDSYIEVMAPPIHTFVFGLLNLMAMGEKADASKTSILGVLQAGEQYMVMSNWLATFRAELAEGDFTGGVVVWALEQGIVSRDQLSDGPADQFGELLERQGARDFFEGAMEVRARRLLEQGQGVTAFDVPTYMDRLRQVHHMHQQYMEMLKY